MENKELLQYLKDAIEVETDLATQEQILECGLAEIEGRKPSRVQLENLPKEPNLDVPKPIGIYILSGCLLFAGLVTLIASFVPGTLVGSALFCTLICGGSGVLLLYFIQKKRNAKIEAIQQTYYASVNRIKENNIKKNKDYTSAVRECNDSCNALRAASYPHINQTKALLEKLYDKNIIYPKYCTLPALTSIYEYFMTGRCTELTGPHGAYNLYEDEVRKDTIINRLDTVIENLEQIRNNQYMLYQQVKSIKENTDIMVSELRQIKGYSIAIAELTALNAYYAQLTERNTRITMYYQL
ncbi:MAG: hypothetical protein IKM05_06555 [Clostridia bacterium]|nr:hypothetical protein [Clostridia bacterium]MBR6753673.1 hypothetical protein [Clostridia bacterium]